MKHLQRFVVWAFVVLILSGCNSSSDGGSASVTPEDSKTSSIPLTTSTIRKIAPGDTLTYTATGSIIAEGKTIELAGTVRGEFLSSNKQSPITSDYCMEYHAIGTLSGGGETVALESHIYFIQDKDGSIYEFGEDGDGEDVWINSPSDGFYILHKSPLAVGQHDGVSLSYTDGSTETYSYSIGSVEAVSTEIGTFDAYPITINRTHDFPYTDDSIIAASKQWYVPSIGSIKIVADESYYSNGVLEFTLSLTTILSSTSVPH